MAGFTSCRPYINSLTKDGGERKELETIHNSIFNDLISSKLFNKWHDYYFMPPVGDGRFTQAKNLISTINDKYGVPVVGTSFTKANSKEFVFVNVKNMVDKLQGDSLFGEAPKKNITVIRHATTMEDEKGQNSGQNDVLLNKEGVQKMTDEAEKLRFQSVDKIYSSPTPRAVQSSEIIKKVAGIPFQTEDGLKAWDLGEFSGKPDGDFDEKYYVEHPDVKVPGGESFNEFVQHTQEALSNIYKDSSNYSILTHSKTVRLMQALESTNGEYAPETAKFYLQSTSVGNEQAKSIDFFNPNPEIGRSLDFYNGDEALKAQEDKEFLQSGKLVSSKASAQTLKKIDELLKRNNITLSLLDRARYGNANGVADILKGIIQIAKGKEDVALTEEYMHFVTNIVKQANPSLYTQMINNIGDYNIYQRVKDEYRILKEYQNPDRSMNVRKIKEEAIGKLLAEYYIKSEEGKTENPELMQQTKTWWGKIVDFIKGMLNKAGFDPFEEVVKNINKFTTDSVEQTQALKDLSKRIYENQPEIELFGNDISGEIAKGNYKEAINQIIQKLENQDTYELTLKNYLGNNIELANDILAYSSKFLQLGEKSPQQKIYDNLKSNNGQVIEKGLSKDKKDTNGDSKEVYIVNGTEVNRKVTDISKNYYKGIFGDGEITKNEYEKAVEGSKLQAGALGHSDVDNAFNNLVDSEGNLRPASLDDTMFKPETTRAIYSTLKNNLQERMSLYSEGTKFLSNTKVYDAKRNIAGTIDFMAVSPDGKIDVIDWKFLGFNTDKNEDVPWYDQIAAKKTSAEYKRIVSEGYDIPYEDVKAKVVPIIAKYKWEKVEGHEKPLPKMVSIEIGKNNVKLEDKDYLLPISPEDQTSGNPELDKVIGKLIGLQKNLEDTKTHTMEDRFSKGEQLTYLQKAIRLLTVKQSIVPLLNQSTVFNKEVENAIDIFNKSLKGKDFNDLDSKNIEEFAKRLNNDWKNIDIYTNLDVSLSSLFEEGADQEGNKVLANELATVSGKARMLKVHLAKIISDFGEYLANSKAYEDIMSPETAIVLGQRLFGETSRLPIKTLQLAYEHLREAKNGYELQTASETEQLNKIGKTYQELSKARGWTHKNEFDIIKNKDENKLIDQYNPKFYKELSSAVKDKNIKWIKENTDFKAYKDKIEEQLKNTIELINNRDWTDGEKMDEIAKKRRLFDTSKDDSLGWFTSKYTLAKFPIGDKWNSEEWNTLNKPENKAALDLYNFIQNVNKKAESAGYLPEGVPARTFLPWVPGGVIDNLIFKGKSTIAENFIHNITLTPEDATYGDVDPSTGKMRNRIPRHYIQETDRTMSSNIIKNVGEYNGFVNKYSYLSQIENTVQLLHTIEQNKKSILTNVMGNAVRDRESGQIRTIDTNEKNTKVFEDHIASLLYGQRYLKDEKFDVVLGKVGNVFEKANKMLGKDVFPTNLSERQFTFVKSIDSINSYFRLKTLGISPLPAISNLVAGKLQAYISAGKWQTKEDIFKADQQLLRAIPIWGGEDGKLLRAMIRYFAPYVNVRQNMSIEYAKLSASKIDSANVQANMLRLMTLGDVFVENTIFTSLLNNAVVIDGKIHNARVYVRNSPEFAARYTNGTLKEQEGTFNKKVKELVDEHSLWNRCSLDEHGNAQIEGFTQDSPEIYKLRNLSVSLAKKATGNMSPDEVRGITQNVITNSMMMFKTRIPTFVESRFGALKHVADTDSYEWGRVRTIARILSKNALSSLTGMVDLLTLNSLSLSVFGKIAKGTPEGVEKLNDLYEFKKEQYLQKTGKKLTEGELTQADFNDMVRQNIRSQAKDFLITASLLSMFLALKAIPDKDEDPDVVNYHKFTIRAIEKISNEMSFYYNPLAFQQILNGSVFPSMGIFTDGALILKNFFQEMYGIAFDHNLEEHTHVAKYVMRSFPVANVMSSYLPLFAPDLAKSMGIKMTAEIPLIR